MSGLLRISNQLKVVKAVSKYRCLLYSTVPTPDPSIVEFKTAFVEKVDYHPNADSLYVSQVRVDSDDNNLLTVCSGLVKFIPKDQLEGRKIVVVTNLKPSKLRGITSEAMLLAAVGNDPNGNKILELVSPPVEAEIGERLSFKNQQETFKLIKPKVWQGIQHFLFVNQNKQVIFRNPTDGEELLKTANGGVATVETLDNGVVS